MIHVSVLFNEPKLLKCFPILSRPICMGFGFSALQRAEIAEISREDLWEYEIVEGFSALQRAEIAEIGIYVLKPPKLLTFQCSSTSRNC